MERYVALRQRPLVGWAMAFALFALAFALRLSFAHTFAPFPLLVFFPVVILAALFSGWAPAIVAMVATVVAYGFVFLPESGTWAAGDRMRTALVFFVVVSLFDIALIEGLRLAILHMRDERRRAAELVAMREAMFKELQHRVANNMQLVSGMLAAQKRRLDGPAADALEQASARMRAMASVHRRLYDPANADRPLGPLIEDLCHELLEATGAKNLVCRVEIPELTLPLDRVVALTLIVNEALTNAVKHAFPDGRSGTIRIAITREDTDQLALSIADNGKGLPENFDAAAADSLGMRIFQALAQQLNGALSFANRNPGAELRLQFQA